MPGLRALPAFALAALLTAPAAAEEPPVAIPTPDRPAQVEDAAMAPFPENWRGMLGPWSLEAADAGRFQCTIALTGEPVIGGYAVDIPTACLVAGPTMDIAAWHIDEADGAVVFTDALRRVVLRLGEAGDGGLYAGAAGSGPQYYLVATE